MGTELGSGVMAGPDERTFTLEVDVRVPPGHVGENIVVKAASAAGEHELPYVQERFAYVAQLPSAEYEVVAASGEMRAAATLHESEATSRFLTLHLGEAGWPRYRVRETIVPFEPPRPDRLAIVFENYPLEMDIAERLIAELADTLSIQPTLSYFGEDRTPFAADGAIWLFEEVSAHQHDAAARFLRERLGPDLRVRLGTPIDLREGFVTVLDNQYVVRFRSGVTGEEIEVLLAGAEADFYPIVAGQKIYRVGFRGGGYEDHLRQVERWRSAELIDYGYPDLMREIVDDGPPPGFPNDPEWGQQSNLEVHGVPQAWTALEAHDPGIRLGDPLVRVATYDTGIDASHHDVHGSLVERYFDFVEMIDRTKIAHVPGNTHGMGVYGIIAARTNNKTAVAGIAPNTTQVVMLRPSYSSATYVSALRWAAGLEVTPDKELGWPDPIDSPAAIICCSHGSGEDLTDYMDRSLTEMATQGRGNLGTLVIYSVGDGDPGTIFTGFRQWAAHPHTMAVANTQAASGDTPERKTPESNYGPALDICAQGQGSRSLGVSNVTRSFGKTSAAAAHVAGVAALVCSVDPNCPAETVRHILTMTATKIDVGGGTWTAKNGRDFSCWYGYGRLDAHAAVKAAIAASRVSV